MARASAATLEEIDRQIEALGYGTPEYHEATAFLLTVMAKRQWILADQARKRRTQLQRRKKKDGQVLPETNGQQG